MNNLYTAVSLSLINRKRFVITTNDTGQLISNFQKLILQRHCQFQNICVIDLEEFTTIEELVEECTVVKDEEYTFKQVIIWKNLQKLDKSEQKLLYEFLIQIDNYDTTRDKNANYCMIGDIKIMKPDLFLVIPVLDLKYYKLKLNQYLKERFPFLINYYYTSFDNMIGEVALIPAHDNYKLLINKLRSKVAKVYVAPDIKRYIYSLVIFTRQHRLCSLSPKETRLSTRSIDEIRLLSQALALWNDPTGENLFVTPDTVKVSMRRIGYWLVDWEYNTEFTTKSSSDTQELHKRLQLTILVGDWYGSDYSCAEKYIESYESKPSKASPTGYTNKIIDEVLTITRPPI